ncbi:MAG: hypothetical protein V3V90_06530 [Thermodesulfobacteriota bacterium]
MPEHDFYRIFIQPIEKLNVEYMVTGAIAAIFYGQPRLTHDIDIVIHLRPSDIDNFCRAFPLEQFYCPPLEVVQIEIGRDQHAHFNLIHHKSGLKADCYPFTGDALHAWAFQNIRNITIDENLSIKLAPPEYVIIRKLMFYREGGAKKHLQDIEAMIEISGDKIDKGFLAKELRNRDLEPLLDELSVKL